MLEENSVREIQTEHPLRVMSLHALLYCERLFYLEEIEEIRVADAAVYAGRRLHEEILPLDDESPERRSFETASEKWGLFGKVDAVRKRNGKWIAYEHKRGRCMRGPKKEPLAWPSDRIQAIAYAALLSETLGESVAEARIRYHTDNVTAKIAVDENALAELRIAISRARYLQQSTQRPPITANEKLCTRCSLAPICLPEEERLAVTVETLEEQDALAVPRLFPSNRQKQTLHICSQKARISRSSETLVVIGEDENHHETKQVVPIEDIESIVIHGYAQVTTQAIHLCSYKGVSIQWMTYGGNFVASTTNSPGRVQQRIRQYEALQSPETCLRLAKALVKAKVEMQLRYVLRCTRGGDERRSQILNEIESIRLCLRRIDQADSTASLLGYEGTAARAYFSAMPSLLSPSVPAELIPRGRSKHPPRDRFNALLSYGYSLLYGLIERTSLAVGLEPSFGFYHRPRSAAPPLVLDMMELFRTNIWEIPMIGSINRMQWNVEEDFTEAANKVWLSAAGRNKAIALFEGRLGEMYKHPHTGQALAYSRMVELEMRLLEKEWSGFSGLFAQLRLR